MDGDDSIVVRSAGLFRYAVCGVWCGMITLIILRVKGQADYTSVPLYRSKKLTNIVRGDHFKERSGIGI